MPEYIIAVTAEEDAALKKVAEKDGKPVEELVLDQMRYYLGCVIKDYVEQPEDLTPEQAIELNTRLAIAKDTYLTEVKQAVAEK